MPNLNEWKGYFIMDNRNVKLLSALNEFCFASEHDQTCTGCIFQNHENCPLARMAVELENFICVAPYKIIENE
jgi:hypothetical protein